MEQPIAYFADDGKSWRCDGCGSYGSVSSASNGRRYAARHIAMHIGECTPEQEATIADCTIIRPGDTILVRVSADTPPAQAQAAAERLRERLPDIADVLVLGADGISVYRPAEHAAGTGGSDCERKAPEAL
ncbi:hypothetical protein [Streptomyces sp. NPDC057428]|uniref:hypothetical protein n=1 Tax=Streptomyces sp. NPDC057428 TaxID=3346129 RepID=UPI0036974D18